MIVIALAHPQEVGGEGLGCAVRWRVASTVQRLALLDQAAAGDAVAITDVRADAVFLDHLAHVLEDRLGAEAIGVPTHGLKR